jgi:hypothetical protein
MSPTGIKGAIRRCKCSLFLHGNMHSRLIYLIHNPNLALTPNVPEKYAINSCDSRILLLSLNHTFTSALVMDLETIFRDE